MSTIVEELKEKVAAAGGDTSGIKTISDGIDALPSGSSGGVAFVTLSDDEATETAYIDKSYNELANLVLVEKKLVFCTGGGFGIGPAEAYAYVDYLDNFSYDYNSDVYTATFYRPEPAQPGFTLYAIDPDAPMQDTPPRGNH